MHITAIFGHPDPDSFNRALAEAYLEGATASGATVERIDLDTLDFDPILHRGYREEQPLEADLVRAQQAITRANHVFVASPVWWGAPPALLKGFFDRTFLPGWAFRFRAGIPIPERLLTGRSAHVLLTFDAPNLVYTFAYARSATRAICTAVLRFCGFGPITTTHVGMVRFLPAPVRDLQLARMRRLGARHARRR